MSGEACGTHTTVIEEPELLSLQRKFLATLLSLQNVERGSLWVKREEGYLCVEAMGSQSEMVRGITVRVDQPSIVGWVMENGRMTIAEAGKDRRHYSKIESNLSIKSTLILCFPLFLKNGEVYGAVQVIDTSSGGNRLNLRKDYLELLQNIVDIGSIALGSSLAYNDKIQENLLLKESLEAFRNERALVGNSPSFLKLIDLAVSYAQTDFPVFITGESGTGKELIAREVHRKGSRKDKPFLVQNCSAIPDTLLESELFGYVKGAFTGAINDKVGLFEAASGGTLFLDEIGDMPVQLQARILRVIQSGEIKPLGGTKTKKVDVRIISATNKNMKKAIAKKQFREDLFYRLKVLPLCLPPLRERREDIPLLLEHFIKSESIKMGCTPKKVSKDALRFLTDYPWRGNIRELENFVKHVMVISKGGMITVDDLSLHFGAAHGEEDLDSPEMPASERHVRPSEDNGGSPASGVSSLSDYTWDELERSYVVSLLEKTKWHVTRAAERAGISRSTFNSRLRKLGIKR